MDLMGPADGGSLHCSDAATFTQSPPSVASQSVDNDTSGALQAYKAIVESLDLFELSIREAAKSNDKNAHKEKLQENEEKFDKLYRGLILTFGKVVHYKTDNLEWWNAILHQLEQRLLSLVSKILDIKIKSPDQSSSKRSLGLSFGKKKKFTAGSFEKIRDMFKHLVALVSTFSSKIMAPYTNRADKQAYGGLLQSAMSWDKPKSLSLEKYLSYQSRNTNDDPENLNTTDWRIKYDLLEAELQNLRTIRCLNCNSSAEEMQQGVAGAHAVEQLQRSLNEAIQSNTLQARELKAKDVILSKLQDEMTDLRNSKSLLSDSIAELVNAKRAEFENLQLALTSASQTIEQLRTELDAKEATLSEYRQDLNDSKSRFQNELLELVKCRDDEVQRRKLATQKANHLIEEKDRLLQQKDQESSEFLVKIQQLTAGKSQSEELTAQLLFERENLTSKLKEYQGNILHLISQIPKYLQVANSKFVGNDDITSDLNITGTLLNRRNDDFKLGAERSRDDSFEIKNIPSAGMLVSPDIGIPNLSKQQPRTDIQYDADLISFDIQELQRSHENVEDESEKKKAACSDSENVMNEHQNRQAILDPAEPETKVHSLQTFAQNDIHSRQEVDRDIERLQTGKEFPVLADRGDSQKESLVTNNLSSSKLELNLLKSDDEVVDNRLNEIVDNSLNSQDKRDDNIREPAESECCKMDPPNDDILSQGPEIRQGGSIQKSPMQDSSTNPVIQSEISQLNPVEAYNGNTVVPDPIPDKDQSTLQGSKPDIVTPVRSDYPTHEPSPLNKFRADSGPTHNKHQDTESGGINPVQLVSIIAVSCISAVILTFSLVSCATKYHIRKKTAKISV